MHSKSDKLPSICILVTQYELGGAQKNAITQARYFSQRGYDVTLGFLYDKYDSLDNLRKSENYKIIDFQAKNPRAGIIYNIWKTIVASYTLYKYLRNNEIQIIETLTPYSNVIGIFVAWLAGVPHRISSQRNSLPDSPKWLIKIDAFIANSPLTTRMICVTETTRRFCIMIEKIDPQKLVIIPNGINVPKYDRQDLRDRKIELRKNYKIHEQSIIILAIGRLHPLKGYPYLIDAAAGIIDKYPNTIFLIAGHGELFQELTERVAKMKLENKIIFLGSRTDIPELLSIADIFILPSLQEGMPNALLEAMAARLPVISTRFEGSEEIITNGETGILVPTADSNALKYALCELLNDPIKRNLYAQFGHNRIVEKFSEVRMCERYESELISDNS